MVESEEERKLREALEKEAEEKAKPDSGEERSGLSKIRDRIADKKKGDEDGKK